MIDRDAAARLGIQPHVVDSTLYSASASARSRSFTRSKTSIMSCSRWIRVQLAPGSLDKIYVKSPTGNQVPLSAIAHFRIGPTRRSRLITRGNSLASRFRLTSLLAAR